MRLERDQRCWAIIRSLRVVEEWMNALVAREHLNWSQYLICVLTPLQTPRPAKNSNMPIHKSPATALAMPDNFKCRMSRGSTHLTSVHQIGSLALPRLRFVTHASPSPVHPFHTSPALRPSPGTCFASPSFHSFRSSVPTLKLSPRSEPHLAARPSSPAV